jgi:tetratricopeptide (TPR) repeat protein
VSQSDFVSRGQALVSAGQYQEAVKVCRLGLLGRPTTVEGRIVLGQALLALKRFDEVLAEMRVALELDHGSVPAQVLKGEALVRKGDGAGALDVLGRLRSQGLADAHVAGLLGEAERLVGRVPPSAGPVHAAPAADPETKHYPMAERTEDLDDVDELSEPPTAAEPGELTSPTSVVQPGARKRPAPTGRGDATPPPAVLAVGDRSGTVEVDPERDGLELRPGEDELGELVGPPVAGVRGLSATLPAPSARMQAQAPAARAAMIAPIAPVEPVGLSAPIEPRGSIQPSTRAGAMAGRKARQAPMFKEEVSTVELDDDAMIEIAEPVRAPIEASTARGLGSAGSGRRGSAEVRAAVRMPSGPLDIAPIANPPVGSPPRGAPAPQLAQMIASQPHVMNVAPAPINPRSAIAAALPTAAAMPMPAPPMQAMPAMPAMVPTAPANAPTIMPGMAHPVASPAVSMPAQQFHLPLHLQSGMAAARPTLALTPMQEQSAATVDALFGPPPAIPAPGAAQPADKPMRTGMRRRSRLQIVAWILVGGAVIGGGVFAGFQIRAIRLRKQIAAARDRAVDLADTDTWQGWLGARDSLYSIAQAAPTLDNRAALARARAVLGYAFGDSPGDARAAVEPLAGQAMLDVELAATYVALSQNDARTARDAAERARQAAPTEAETFYVAGEAALLAGDVKGAIDDLKKAVEHEARPLYAVGLARALGAAAQWDDALAALDKYADNPGAVIAKAELYAGAGRAAGAPGEGARAQLVKVIAEGGKPAADQPRGVSPMQVALADLALAQLDFARGELATARADYKASLELQLNDQRFAEALIETVYALGELDVARKAAVRALESWPTSRRARTTLAQVWIALGKPNAAIDLFAKTADAAVWPKGQTVRGLARQAVGDAEGARGDFDAVLKKLPAYEPALVARTWLDLAAGDLEAARQRIEPKFNPKTATASVLATYAEIQRLGGDPAARDKAKALLEHAAVGPADTARVQLELARIDRDLGDLDAAKAAYALASRTGNFEARLEGALLQIENSEPQAGHTMLEQLLKDSGDHPPALLLLETARSRTLVGAHAGATELLALAEKTPNVVAWQLDRERARLALRRLDTAGAAQALVRALAGCGGDLDTFILAADTVSNDDKQAALTQKLTQLAATRLKGKPELEIVSAKLDLAANKQDEAERRYTTAQAALLKEKATPRRRAQAAFGLAAIAYFKRDDPTAKSMFDLVMVQDPSLHVAYLFAAELARPKAPDEALKLAQQAAALDPDSLDAWKIVGTLGAQLKRPSLVKDAITRVGDLAPNSETLHQLQALQR